jgi:5S rRNA maturation endonuclease (ribonuclease M5)
MRSPSPPDFPFTLFIDENHCRNKALLSGLDSVNIKYELHCNHFDRGADDRAWIPFAGDQGWLVITTDDRIRRRALEKRGVLRKKVRLFVFTDNNTFGALMAERLVAALPEMKALIEKQAPPLMASITKSGNVVQLWPKN